MVVKPQHMDVWLRPGAWVDPAKMLALTRRSNLKALPDEIRLTVTGRVEQQDGSLRVALDEMKTPVELVIVPDAKAPEQAAHLAAEAGSRVEVEGYWHANAPGALAITSFKRLDDTLTGR